MARSLAGCSSEFAARWSSLKLMVSLIRSPAIRLLQASSRDDHGLLCTNRRVIGTIKRVRRGWNRQDHSREEGCERTGCADGMDRFPGVRREPGWPGSWTAVAMAFHGNEAGRTRGRVAGDTPRSGCLQRHACED